MGEREQYGISQIFLGITVILTRTIPKQDVQ